MKRFIIKTVIFALPIFAILSCLEFILRQIPDDYTYKAEWIRNNGQTVKILNLGSSHAYFGIDPNCFSKSAFNLAETSQGIQEDDLVFSYSIPYLDSLEILIVPISYFSMIGKLKDGTEKWRHKYYHPFMNDFRTNIDANPFYIFPLNNSTWEKATNWLSKQEEYTIINCDSLGKGSHPETNTTFDMDETGLAAAERHTHMPYSRIKYKENLLALKHIIELCDEKHAKVVLVNTPTTEFYRKHLDSNQLKLMYHVCDSISKQKNVYWLNYFDGEGFSIDDFYDADHLNEQGAQHFSTRLAHDLDSLNIYP